MPKFHHLAGAPVSARLSAHVEPWFQAATSVQMENLRSYGCVVSGVCGEWCVVWCVVWCGVVSSLGQSDGDRIVVSCNLESVLCRCLCLYIYIYIYLFIYLLMSL